jgi:hypothetical protein
MNESRFTRTTFRPIFEACANDLKREAERIAHERGGAPNAG